MGLLYCVDLFFQVFIDFLHEYLCVVLYCQILPLLKHPIVVVCGPTVLFPQFL